MSGPITASGFCAKQAELEKTSLQRPAPLPRALSYNKERKSDIYNYRARKPLPTVPAPLGTKMFLIY